MPGLAAEFPVACVFTVPSTGDPVSLCAVTEKPHVGTHPGDRKPSGPGIPEPGEVRALPSLGRVQGAASLRHVQDLGDRACHFPAPAVPWNGYLGGSSTLSS